MLYPGFNPESLSGIDPGAGPNDAKAFCVKKLMILTARGMPLIAVSCAA
jgi:hypothetical protein